MFDYARHRGFRDLRQLDNLDVVTKFVESWQNLNPHRNKSVFQQKTEDWVCIPIPDFVEAELRKLKFKGTKDGCHYWFWTCEGGLDTAITNWRERVSRLLAVAQRAQPFAHKVTTHSFRHTFSIRHLNAGTDIKFVSRWLGHASVLTTEKHYAHAIRGTMIASEEAYDQSIARQANHGHLLDGLAFEQKVRQ